MRKYQLKRAIVFWWIISATCNRGTKNRIRKYLDHELWAVVVPQHPLSISLSLCHSGYWFPLLCFPTTIKFFQTINKNKFFLLYLIITGILFTRTWNSSVSCPQGKQGIDTDLGDSYRMGSPSDTYSSIFGSGFSSGILLRLKEPLPTPKSPSQWLI